MTAALSAVQPTKNPEQRSWRFFAAMSQTRTFSGSLEARLLPSGDHDRATQSPPSKEWIGLPEHASQRRTVLSPLLADAIVLPSGDQASAPTLSVCPWSVWIRRPEAATQICTVFSAA